MARTSPEPGDRSALPILLILVGLLMMYIGTGWIVTSEQGRLQALGWLPWGSSNDDIIGAICVTVGALVLGGGIYGAVSLCRWGRVAEAIAVGLASFWPTYVGALYVIAHITDHHTTITVMAGHWFGHGLIIPAYLVGRWWSRRLWKGVEERRANAQTHALEQVKAARQMTQDWTDRNSEGTR